VGNQKTRYYATSNNLSFCTIQQNEETRKSHFPLSWTVLHAQCTYLLYFWKKEKIVICDVSDSPCPCIPVARPLGRICSRAWRSLCSAGSRFNSSRGLVRRVRLRKSNYVKIIPTHMMIREIITGRQQTVRR